MAKLPLKVMDELFKRAEIQRSTYGAKIQLKTELETKALEISRKAFNFTKHSKRKTIKSKDIILSLTDF